jgi:hypothetical protein
VILRRPCADPGRIVWISARLPAMVAGYGSWTCEAIMIWHGRVSFCAPFPDGP